MDTALDDAEARRTRELVAELRRIHAEEAALHARRLRVLARAYALAETQQARVPSSRSKEREMPLRALAAELGLPTRVNDRTMQAHMWDAHRLTTAFPATVASLERGEISRGHAGAILDSGAVIDDAAARAEFERAVLEYAWTSTPARTRAFARQQADIHNPLTLGERHELASEGRRVWVTDLDDGMSLLSHLLPTVLAHGILDRTTRQAKLIKRVDADRRHSHDGGTASTDSAPPLAADEPFSDEVWFDERTIDQIRADLVADMLLTGSPHIDPTCDATPGGLGAIRAIVQITVPVTTLTGVTAGGAELDGVAPIDPDTARRLAGDPPGWDRVMTHPITGMVLAVDRYQPTAAQQRYLRARDQHCRFPGCRRPARLCDSDHTRDHASGGPTDIRNLASLCRRHHTLKHASEWTVHQLPGGSLEWTSPAGHDYVDHPPRRVVFLPSDEGVAPF